MSGKAGAYGARANDTDFRKKWDKEEYAEKARQHDQEEKERMQENEERMKQGSDFLLNIFDSNTLLIFFITGKKPRKGRREDLPKPTELMKRREGSLELDKNLNKTMVVQNSGTRGPGVPGFYCEACNRTYKDSTGYLDHINGRARESRSSIYYISGSFFSSDLRALGQTTRIERSTVEQVRARIAFLREKTKEASSAKSFDFEKRLAEVREREAEIRAEKKASKKAERERARMELVKDAAPTQDENDMMHMMGFSGFGSSKK